MMVLGIVGGIGAGKTEVLGLLAELGAATVAADELSREALAAGQPALSQVQEAFGPEYFDHRGQLRRRKLGDLVFADEGARGKLDEIVHPVMLALLREKLARWREGGVAVAAVEAAVMEEMGALPLLDKVILVTAPEEVRLRRLRERDGLGEEEARRRLETHQRLGLVSAAADCVIVNEGDREGLRRQVEQFWLTVVRKIR